MSDQPSIPYSRKRLIHPGNGRHGPHRRDINRSWHSPLHHPDRRRYSRSLYCPSSIPRRPCRFHNAWRRDDHRPGRHYRDDSNRAARLYDIHAGCRKAPGELHSTSRHRIESFHRRARRYASSIFPEPRTLHSYPFPSLPFAAPGSPSKIKHPPLTSNHPRCLLDRRLPQPRPVLRPRRRHPHLPHHAMDLLGRPHLRLPLRSPALQTHQIPRIRERESGPGARAFGGRENG